jgi:uncharacterized protein
MSGELSLTRLLASLQPSLQPGTYAWVTMKTNIEPASMQELNAAAVFIFKEREGLTVVLPVEAADKHGLSYTYPSRQIILDIHSSLEAVGFMAAISTRLAEQGFSANPVSAYYHDHLFVKADEAEQVLETLKAMSEDAQQAS